MSTTFISGDIWKEITKEVRKSKKTCSVAVAYFGAGASKLLPLPKGSRLVVDGSEHAVKSGQTCPADLIKLHKRGVTVYSVSNLHAKVFVLGRVAYIGSTNVSASSAFRLVEAGVRTTETTILRAAQKFVHDHCLYELTPEVLKNLAKIYRPPHIPGGKKQREEGKETAQRPTMPRLLIAKLKHASLPDGYSEHHDAGWEIAEKRSKQSRNYKMESFWWYQSCPFKQGDVVVQVTEYGDGKMLVSSPATVLYVLKRNIKGRDASFVYLERQNKRRRYLEPLAKDLGPGAEKRLRRGGVVREDFAHALMDIWKD